MLKIKEGDLFAHAEAPCVILHGCNAQGKMNAGFAKELRSRFPDAYKVYKTAQETHGLTVGDVNGYVDTNGFTIINGITQERYGRDADTVYVDYEGTKKVCDTVARYVLGQAGGEYPIHMPFIGSGLANGNRDKLLEIFTESFKDVNVTLWLN